MLRNTLILPESDARLAARLLQEAVDALDLVLMLVVGKDEESVKAVEWADRLSMRTLLPDGRNPRKVVWVRDVSSATLEGALRGLLGEGDLPRIFVLNFHDVVQGKVGVGERFNPLALELLFLRAQQVEARP